MTTERLFEFLVLSQTLSYSQAAKKLFITQSALSRHIMDMEKELGVKLLERSTHGVKLTAEGRLLAHRSRHLIKKSEELTGRLRSGDIGANGSVRVACLENVGHGSLVIFFSAFTAKYPDIELTVDVISDSDRFGVLSRYDITFSAFELQNLSPDIEMRTAFRTPAVLYILGEYGNIKSHHVGLEALKGKTLFVPYADEMFCSYATNRQLAEKLTGGDIKIVKVPSVESALMMSALGLGVTIVPRHTPESSMTNVLSIDISTPGCVFDTYMYWNKGRSNPAARVMAEELRSFIESSEG